MSEDSVFKIRPAGRHLLTIGKDLIQDRYAAVVELVKNAYDADSPDVLIEFKNTADGNGYSVIITDHGHGMTRDTVTGAWMVPSTKDKLDRKTSPEGRILQGRKGIGRYAASILGKDLLLETVTKEKELTTLLLNWDDFDHAEFLSDVDVLIETKQTTKSKGTTLTIHANSDFSKDWNEDEFRSLRYELKKLKSPQGLFKGVDKKKDSFKIKLLFRGFEHLNGGTEEIVPFPILDLFDYRIYGEVAETGEGKFYYSQQNVRNSVESVISYHFGKPTACGVIKFDIRVFDREKEAIGSLIERGLTDEKGNFVGKNEARSILNRSNGVGVYRNGFRIRPLGDPDFDWLSLNKKRIQKPSIKIGSNQVIGAVHIESEEKSGLKEKSARDGLKENDAYRSLQYITSDVIGLLESRRFKYRQKAGLSRSALKVEQELEKVFSHEKLKNHVKRKLKDHDIEDIVIEDILDGFDQDAKEKNKIVERLRQTFAIYQGEATLGKILDVVLHEGRQPLSNLKNNIPRLTKKTAKFEKSRQIEDAQQIEKIANKLICDIDIFVSLFSRLDPLATRERDENITLQVRQEIEKAIDLFSHAQNILQVKLEISGNIEVLGHAQDIIYVFTNLIDNSLYWMNAKNSPNKKITIELFQEGSEQWVDYKDTGPGIEPDLIDKNLIFDPHFSTKPNGTGLGLAIAGEAALRFGMDLKVMKSNSGAYFRLEKREE